MGLPLGYPKASYSWCLDYKHMGKCCITSTGLREWTKEEMMAYLDWDKAEADRIEAQVAEETENGRLFTSRRGMGKLWEMAQRDIDEPALPANQMQLNKLPNKSIKYLEILFQTNKSKILDLK
jgi:hypothetical protein